MGLASGFGVLRLGWRDTPTGFGNGVRLSLLWPLNRSSRHGLVVERDIVMLTLKAAPKSQEENPTSEVRLSDGLFAVDVAQMPLSELVHKT